ncbi:MAG: hypothetical protein LBN30_00090 [Oscillospiraceae bacterium]|nr:hypothetical protein [Oscillospiraceae bacterium]
MDISDDAWRRRIDKRNAEYHCGDYLYVEDSLVETCLKHWEQPELWEIDLWLD